MNDLVTIAQYAERIRAAWRQSVEGVLEAGRLLRQAQEELSADFYKRLVDAELPFTRRTAERLIAICKDERITTHVSDMPTHWGTLYELTRLDDDTFAARMEDGTICADMERKDISTTIKQQARATREFLLGQKILHAPAHKMAVIVEDFEWDHVTWSDKGRDRAADNHYIVARDAHTAEEIIARTKDRFECAADDCVLWMWSTVQHLAVAIDVMRLRGFDYKSHYAWGKDSISLGYWGRNKHEILLIGVRGNIPCPAPGTQWESLILAPKGKHSAKPETFLEMIEQYFPTLPKIELNRRGPKRGGWDAWGNESDESFDTETGEIHQSGAFPPPPGPACVDDAPQPLTHAGSSYFCPSEV